MDQFYTELNIGGRMTFRQVLTVLDFISTVVSPYPNVSYNNSIVETTEENFVFLNNEEVKEALQEFNGKSPIKLVDYAYPSGALDELKETLEREKIPFVLRTAGTKIYHPELVVFRPDDDLPSSQHIHTYQVTFDNYVLIPWECLEKKPYMPVGDLVDYCPSKEYLDLPVFYCEELGKKNNSGFNIRTKIFPESDEPIYQAWCDELGRSICCGKGYTEIEAIQDFRHNMEEHVDQLKELVNSMNVKE